MQRLLVFALLLPACALAATGDWRDDVPGRTHLIDPARLRAPYATDAAGNQPAVVPQPTGAKLSVPPGFHVTLFASDLGGPRVIRVAPDGLVFVAQSEAGRIRVFKTADGIARPVSQSVFARDLNRPYGIAFYPPGPDPKFVYVGETNRLVRFAYHAGATTPDGPREVILDHLPTGFHWTRDVAVAPDGSRLFVSVGSGSNVADGVPVTPPAGFVAANTLGAAWGSERRRADVLSLDPLGHDVRVYATGLRNCSGEMIEPGTGQLWCATNERDGLGDDLPPDYVTRVRAGGFYGWPWYYTGNHPDPNHGRDRADLAGQAITPDVLIQPHSAPLGLVFYTGAMFPPEWRGRGFVALHGSWNRNTRTGYKVIWFDPARNGYVDFLTGFVASDDAVWGRPVDVAVAHDGALLVSEDGNGTIWRISH